MRAIEITEAFDASYPITWSGSMDAYFYDKHNQQIHVSFGDFAAGAIWYVSFAIENNHDLTGSGDEFRIFATVVSAIREFIARVQPGILTFVSAKSDASRTPLYQRMVNRLTSGTDYVDISRNLSVVKDLQVRSRVEKMQQKFESVDTFFIANKSVINTENSMRAHELNEIDRMPDNDYTGELSLGRGKRPERLYPLPGGKGFQFGYERVDGELKLQVYNEQMKNIAVLVLEASMNPIFKNTWTVDYVTTDQNYRGQGISKALYYVVLKVMKITLEAGYRQTTGGRRNWVSLVNMPGVEVKGMIVLDDMLLPPDTKDKAQRLRGYEQDIAQENMDLIMSMGAEYLGERRGEHFFSFDVVPSTGELAPYVKNKLSTIYDGNASLYARWVG